VPLALRPTRGWLDGLAVAAAIVTLTVLEWRRPLRRRLERPLRHDARNLAIAAVAGASLALVQTPLVLPLTHMVERRGLGLLKLVALPRAIQTLLAIALMDYTLYLWHVLTHKVDFLWRFH